MPSLLASSLVRMRGPRIQLEGDGHLPPALSAGPGARLGASPSACMSRTAVLEYIMRNAGLEEAQAGSKIAGRNINNFRYADDTTLMAESEEELKSLLMKVK